MCLKQFNFIDEYKIVTEESQVVKTPAVIRKFERKKMFPGYAAKVTL